MLCSVNFHLFNCISPRASSHFLKLDLCGIGCAILGCYICGLHLTFECFQNWRLRYETMIVGIVIISVIYYIHGVKRYITRNNHVALFIAISLSGFIPSLHWYYLEGGWSNPFIRHFFPKILILYGILTIGVFAYLTKFPERLFPGGMSMDLMWERLTLIRSFFRFFWYFFFESSDLAFCNVGCIHMVVSQFYCANALSSDKSLWYTTRMTQIIF